MVGILVWNFVGGTDCWVAREIGSCKSAHFGARRSHGLYSMMAGSF